MNTKMPLTKIEINVKTSKWRFLDTQLGIYSSDEWSTKLEAHKHAAKYRRKHGIK